MNPKYVDRRAVTAELKRIMQKREELKRRQATLRVQAHRLRKLLEAADAANPSQPSRPGRKV